MGHVLDDDKPCHECGVVGVYLAEAAVGEPAEAARTAFYGLFALQHRGQESAGIAAVDENGEALVHKAMGLVSEVFSPAVIEGLPGRIAVGHVRYSTTGGSRLLNAQPLVFSYLRGMVALAHNGNLVNYLELRDRLATLGSVFQTSTDTEVIGNLLARYSQDRLEDALIKTMIDVKGGYALVLAARDTLVGVRDPLGIRPLCLGKLEGGYVLASESCALDTIGAEFLRDVAPGEIVVIDSRGVTSLCALQSRQRAHCVFEYIYFARPDSTLDGINVNRARRAMGAQLARETRLEADIVVPVPDSGTSAALGYAAQSGIPFEEGLMKNRYVGRTFIQPTQKMRDLGVRLKLNPVAEVVAGRRIILVDDSIVRGTTSRQIVSMLRTAGAKEVHLVVASPPTCHSCYYGIDTHLPELIAARLDVEGIRAFIGADSLHYLSVEGMFSALDRGGEGFCVACFDGRYPVPVEGVREGGCG